MNLETLFCPNIDCPSRGQVGKGNIKIHSKKEKRCLCTQCQKTFAASKGTIFYRLRVDPKTVITVIVLLAYGCPLQAIVKAFGFDERTVKGWWEKAGTHCQAVHEKMVGSQQMDLCQVQADEIKVKVQGGYLWQAMAIMVPTRLWLGGDVSHNRDNNLIRRLVDRIKSMALCRPLLLAVDGLPGYVNAFRSAFTTKLPREGRPGRPHLFSWPDIAIVQVIKHRVDHKLEIERRIVQGDPAQIESLRHRSQAGPGVINTAYIERLNATFRQRLPWLTRRARNLAQQAGTISSGMFVVGCFYNLCDFHHSLRLRLSVGKNGFRWVHRTPAIAAGLTDHQWTPDELLTFRVPPSRWSPPKRRGRCSKKMLALVQRWCL